jgi:hypothetical protein
MAICLCDLPRHHSLGDDKAAGFIAARPSGSLSVFLAGGG